MNEKALVLFSGGIDSTICLALAIKKYGQKNVEAITINYGQRNDREIESAEKISNYYKVKNKVIDISNIFDDANCSLLKKSKIDIPEKKYEEQVKELKDGENVSTNVPFRNGLMLSVCASYAVANGFSAIYYGIHREEGVAETLYPDCGEEFNLSMNLAIYIGSGKMVKIVAPLSGLLKNEVIKIGIDNNVPFDLTWTCYEDNSKPCGKCTACMDRIKGFKENDIEDPVEYMEG